MANDLYTITGQAEVLDTTDVTNPRPAMRVTFKSKASGVSGTVTIPLSDYSPASVHDLVTERVTAIDAVHEL